MNTEHLLAHYERVAEGPDSVARLRRFIFELVLRGRLVVSEAAWAATTLGEIGEWGSGGTPLKAHPEYYNGDIPWLVIGDLNDGIVRSAETLITKAGLDNSSAKLVEPGTVLIAMYGSIGKLGIAGIRCATNQAIAFCVPHHKLISVEFLFLLLRGIRHDLLARGQGVAQQNISQKILKAYPISLPPLAEQHRIVAKVDELMALCDQLEAARAQREATRDRLTESTLARLNTPEPPASPDGDAPKESSFQSDARFALKVLPALTTRPDQIKQLRRTILNLAVQGKLVPQVSRDGPAGRLLEKLKAAKQVAHEAEELRPRVPPRPPSRSDLNFDFPMAWDLAAFDDLFVIVSGVTKGQKIPASESIEAPYLRVANVQRGYLDLDVIKTISVRASDIRRYALRVGDILMTEGGDWDKLGRAAVWRDEVPGCIHQNHVFRVRPPTPEIAPEWVTTYVNSPLGRAFFEDASKQTTNLASINMTQLRSCPIPLPPTAEQHRIVAKVDELMSLCDQLEASLTGGENTRSRLINSLLHEALAPAESILEAA